MCVLRERSLVLTELSLLIALPRVVWVHSMHKHGLQDRKEVSGQRCFSSTLRMFVTKHQVKFVCDSLGMKFSEELNSHNCSFVVCCTAGGAEGDAALPVTGDKMLQVSAPQRLQSTCMA